MSCLIFFSHLVDASAEDEKFDKAGELVNMLSSSEVNSSGFYPLEGFEVMRDLYNFDHKTTDSSQKIINQIRKNEIYTDKQKILLSNVVYATDVMAYGSDDYAKNKDFSRFIFSTSLCSAKLFSGDFVSEIVDSMAMVIGDSIEASQNYETRSMIIQSTFHWPLPKDEDFRYICGILIES